MASAADRGRPRRDVASQARPHVGLKLPFVNHRSAYCKRIDAAGRSGRLGRLGRGEMMKIYMLMVLIGAIAAMSHLSSGRAGSLITAAFRARRRTGG
jgi:hypothetical protein